MRLPVVAATLLLSSPVIVLPQDRPQLPSPDTPTSGTPGGTAAQQRPQSPTPLTGTAILRGRVVRADTGQPLRRAQVQTFKTELHAAVTDDAGRYELTKLPAGTYYVSASKGGHVQMQYGQRRPSGFGRPITVVDGQVIEKVDFALSPGGIITGRLVDDGGEPVVGASVQAVRAATASRRGQQPATNGQSSTDDRGEFRLFGLPPGDYYVLATPGIQGDLPGGRLAYAKTYYPGTASRTDAQRITLQGGEEAAGISFALSSSRATSLSGVVRSSDGTATEMAMIAVRPKTDDADASEISLAMSRTDGSFVITNIAPGDYVVEARSISKPEVESQPVEVTLGDRDVSGLVLMVGRGATARGRIRFDTGAPPRDMRPDLVRVFPVSPTPQESSRISGGTMPGPPRDDWTFELTGLTGRRLLRADSLRDDTWSMKSVRVDGVDVTDTPIDFKGGDVDGIEVILTQRVTEISGGVTDDRGAKVMDGTVLAFAVEREKWAAGTRFTHQSGLDQDGRFRLRRLPPASYIVIAVDDLEPGDENDPEILERLLPKGTRVTLREGEMRTLDLKISGF